jgi:hypothetical protein
LASHQTLRLVRAGSRACCVVRPPLLGRVLHPDDLGVNAQALSFCKILNLQIGPD